MSRFFVGQRVRVVYSPALRHFVGRETRITGIASGMYMAWGYEWLITHDGATYGARSIHLEPILPEGHRACEEHFKRDLDKLLERADASQHHA